MNKGFKISILILSILLLSQSSSFVFGQSDNQVSEEIRVLNNQIEGQRKQLTNIQQRQKEYATLVLELQKQKNTLENQLATIDTRIKQTELEIESAQLEISRTNLELKKIAIDIYNNNEQINKEKNHISSLLRMLYKQNKATPLEILLLNESLTDFIDQVQYLEDVNREVKESIKSLKKNKENLDKQELDLISKENELQELKKELDTRQLALEGEMESKSFFLEETQKSEAEFQRLSALAKQEYDNATREIAQLEVEVRRKMESMSREELSNFSDQGFVWPVPKNVITSRFHDPSYPFRRVIGEHSAIDIRAAQGTTLRATASGYVARVKFDGSTSYAFIMIVHSDGYSSVYGHVSAVNVKADQYVAQGQIIGRTGGAPRTPGAGPFSTGPHLHFEIRKNGIPINPHPLLP